MIESKQDSNESETKSVLPPWLFPVLVVLLRVMLVSAAAVLAKYGIDVGDMVNTVFGSSVVALVTAWSLFEKKKNGTLSKTKTTKTTSSIVVVDQTPVKRQ